MSTLLYYLPFLLLYAVLAIYAERKLSAFIQHRLGPMETGPYGIAQTIADLLKLIQKEDIVPTQADRALFKAAPLLIFIVVFAGFAFLPVHAGWSGGGVSSGIFLLLAIIALDVIVIVMAGWSSANKYATLGAFRAAAQLISYEVPLGLSVLCVVMVSGTLDLQLLSARQGISQEPAFLFGIPAGALNVAQVGGFLTWNVLQTPTLFLAWVIFFIATLAESNRAPFDLPEAESELVAGFHTEYSGFRWAIIMLAEYAMMLLVSLLGAILFFGGWNSPFPNIGTVALGTWTSGPVWGTLWLSGKALLFVGIHIWIRWTYPRLRIDQLMKLSWKYLTPLALALVMLTGIWRLMAL